MADVFSTKRRGEVMSKIRSTGTTVEDVLHKIVRESIGSQRRIHRNVRNLPGRPDIVIPSLQIAIFADGCFYHGCPKHGHTPKSNRRYWVPKLARNCQRDRVNRQSLRRLGFSVWAIWEHALEGRRIERTRLILQRRIQRLIETKKAQANSPSRSLSRRPQASQRGIRS
jgi:DNA mismatch endonuclease, patch repair protein